MPTIEDYQWRQVHCTRCGRDYICTPFDDWVIPADWIGWTLGPVCEPCLHQLADEARKQEGEPRGN